MTLIMNLQNLQQKNGMLLMIKITDIKFIKSSICDYLNAYIILTGDITATGGNADTKVTFKNCVLFATYATHINNEHIDTAENIDIIKSMHNLIGYNDNYSDTSASLWQFKRDESNVTNPADVATANSASFKYKSSFFKALTDDDNGEFKYVKITVPLKHLSNFWRSLEMSLINCKTHLDLNWTKNCVMSNIAGETTFKITQNHTFPLLLCQLKTL